MAFFGKSTCFFEYFTTQQSFQTSSRQEDGGKVSKLWQMPSQSLCPQALSWLSPSKVSQVGEQDSRLTSKVFFYLPFFVVTSVGMELGQVLNEDQRKERFSHSLQQKRAHKQMSEEASNLSLNSRMVTSPAKAPKLETRTLLQKFLDGRKPENQPKFGVDIPVSEAQSPTTRSLTDHQESKRAEENRMKVRTDLLAQGMLPTCNQSRGSQDSTKKDSAWIPTSIVQGLNGIDLYPPFLRHHSVIQPPQTWPNLSWGLPSVWASIRTSSPSLLFPSFTPHPPCEELSRSEPDTTTPSEKLWETSIQNVCDKDQFDLKLCEEKDKKMVMDYIHKKFRRTESPSTYQPPPP